MIKNKVIVITGASQGIGEQIAASFSKSGARIVLAARNLKKLKTISKQLKTEHLICKTDVREEDSVKELIAKTMERFNRIDVLINNAGYVDPVGLLEMTLEQWNNMINTNLTGTFLCTREVVKYMKKSGGRIINIASSAGLSARPGWSGYAASKAGVINFSITMSEELRIYNIKVFCLCPGRTATNLRRRLAPNEDPTTIMQPRAVVETIKYCLSPQSDVIDGQPIQVRER
jgi:3-oxoacyl-[acyl-carrier protein] reductase